MRACPGPARHLHVALHDFIEGSDVTYDPVCHESETSLSLGFPRFLHVRNWGDSEKVENEGGGAKFHKIPGDAGLVSKSQYTQPLKNAYRLVLLGHFSPDPWLQPPHLPVRFRAALSPWPFVAVSLCLSRRARLRPSMLTGRSLNLQRQSFPDRWNVCH